MSWSCRAQPDAATSAAVEAGPAAGQLLPAAHLVDLDLGPDGGAQHLFPGPGRPGLPGPLCRAGRAGLGARGSRGCRDLAQAGANDRGHLGSGRRPLPAKPGHHTAHSRGGRSPDLHAQAELAHEPPPARRTALRQHCLPAPPRTRAPGHATARAATAHRADTLDSPGHPRRGAGVAGPADGAGTVPSPCRPVEPPA